MRIHGFLFCLALSLPALGFAGFLPFDDNLTPRRIGHLQAAGPDTGIETGSSADPMAVTADWAIRIFQVFISPQDGPSCMYEPTCSRYGYLSFRRYGFFTGFLMTADRWLRCNPFGYPGEDLPEDNYFGKKR